MEFSICEYSQLHNFRKIHKYKIFSSIIHVSKLEYLIKIFKFEGHKFFFEIEKQTVQAIVKPLPKITYKKADSSDTSSSNEWQRMKTSDSKWQWEVQRVTKSSTTSDSEW